MGRTRKKNVHWAAFVRVKDFGGKTLCGLHFGYSRPADRNYDPKSGKTIKMAGKTVEITCRDCLKEAARLDAERDQRLYAQSHCPI